MRRRKFIALVGATIVWPSAARAQRGLRRIAVMMTNAEDDPEGMSRAAAFREGLSEFGWIEGENLRIDWHWSAGDVDRIRATAADLAAHAPDLVVANGTPNLSALVQATHAIPIVFVVVNDPLGQGFIASLARPGGNITGFAFFEPTMFGKSLELLKQLAPSVARVAFMFNPETSPYYGGFMPEFAAAARSYGVATSEAPVRSEAEIGAVVSALAAAPGGGLIVLPDAYALVNRALIIKAASQHRIPAIYAYRQLVREGGLMSYGPETADIFRNAASYVDRVLRGANPAELPVQAPSKFELAVNISTASALGLTVPVTLTALADEVVE
jgi:putative tryptophan/tyrosine transport system substrate-binding protein